ncbi:Fatty-acid-CoA ligase FadD6, partial [Quaeritorhiza haematococci]
ETSRKVLRDVFRKSDEWFRTGDLLRRDEEGYFYYVDRIGDTFRWKGENVSTTEIASSIASYPGILEANVYGVKVPHHEDGRAGMVSLVVQEPRANGDGSGFDVGGLLGHLKRVGVPRYAVPIWVRIQKE